MCLEHNDDTDSREVDRTAVFMDVLILLEPKVTGFNLSPPQLLFLKEKQTFYLSALQSV